MQNRKSQKMLYKGFYGFAMSICLRYAADRDEAADILNKGFYKVFTKIATYDVHKPFKAWVGRIMTNTAIDHYRANLKMAYAEDLEQAEHIGEVSVADNNLNYSDLLAMVQELPQSYRTVFNLFAIDGYSHEEIAAMLNISVGTSKSNLFKARQKLKQLILNADALANNYTRRADFTTMVAINGSASLKPTYFSAGFEE